MHGHNWVTISLAVLRPDSITGEQIGFVISSEGLYFLNSTEMTSVPIIISIYYTLDTLTVTSSR